MTDLTSSNFATMSKDTLRTLLGETIGYSSSDEAEKLPKQRIVLYKLPGMSSMSKRQLQNLALQTRDRSVAGGKPFYTWNSTGRTYVEHSNPVVQWGRLPVSHKRKRNEAAVSMLSRHLPTELTALIVPPPPTMYAVGDILVTTRTRHPEFFMVRGHTKSGAPQLRALTMRSISENRRHMGGTSYVLHQVVPEETSDAGPRRYYKSMDLRRWNGTPLPNRRND